SLCATAPTTLHTRSLHDALPISDDPPALRTALPAVVSLSSVCPLYSASTPPNPVPARAASRAPAELPTKVSPPAARPAAHSPDSDRKSTRLNSSHVKISYAVFCL